MLKFFSLINGALELAETIAKKSPVAVQLTKKSILYSRDHTVEQGLEHIVSLFLTTVLFNPPAEKTCLNANILFFL